ncbi:hypothetical protein ACWGHM_15595 [Streptomyces sp. NPDC054904]
MSWTRAIYGDRSAPGGALRAFFRSWAGDITSAPIAEQVKDGLISGMRIARTVLGLVAATGLVVVYPLSSDGAEFVLGKLAELGFACVVLAVGSIIGMTAFIVASTPDRRRDFAERVRRPISAGFMLFIGPICAWVSFQTLRGDLVSGDDLYAFFSAFAGPGYTSSLLAILTMVIGWLAALVLLLGSVPFSFLACYSCLVTCLRASDVHQLLPALLSPLLVWSLLAFQLFIGPDVAAPAEVLYTFLLSGPLSVTALSVWEVRRLGRRHGVTLRVALGR